MIFYVAQVTNDSFTKINLGVVFVYVIILHFLRPEEILEGGDTRVQAHVQ